MVLRPTITVLGALGLWGLVVLRAVPAPAGEPEYLNAIADLPLPPGLVEDVDAGLSFDKPGGRIVEALARGALAKSDVAAFYRATLPALGWKPLVDAPSGSRWLRGGETLSVDIVEGTSPIVVRFSITPN